MKTSVNINPKKLEPIMASAAPDEVSASDFLAKVDSQLTQGVNLVQIDCTPLVRVASSNINSLWLAREKCNGCGAKIELINVNNGLRRVLEALDLATVFLPESAGSLRFCLQFALTVAGIDSAMSEVVGFLTKSGLPESTAFELQTVFYEVTTNVRLHSELTPLEPMTFGAEIKGRSVDFTFTDRGVSFDPTSYGSNVDFQEAGRGLRRNGFGLEMITRLTDSMEYVRTADERNQLITKKSW